MKKNYYTLLSEGSSLSLNKYSTQNEIKRAFKKMALRHHPDKGVEELFKMYHQAYEVLSNPFRRLQYDMTINNATPKPATPKPATPLFTKPKVTPDTHGATHTQKKDNPQSKENKEKHTFFNYSRLNCTPTKKTQV